MLGKHTESDKSFPLGPYDRGNGGLACGVSPRQQKISWTALLFALAMGVSRIYLSVHYATDVLGGEECFHNAVVIAVALSGHRLDDSMFLQFFSVENVLVLPA